VERTLTGGTMMTQPRRIRTGIALGAVLTVLGCGDKGQADTGTDGVTGIDPGDGGTAMATGTVGEDDSGDDEGDDDSPVTTNATSPEPGPPPVIFDLGGLPDAPHFTNCGAPAPVTCDGDDDDPIHALGLYCPGGPQVDAQVNGSNQAFLVYEGPLGSSNPAEYPPREGTKFLIMATGIATQLDVAGTFTSTDLGGNDPINNLPAPLTMNRVSATETCARNPGLVGTGECSNTMQSQWSQGSGARDYAEVRINVDVPTATYGFSYDFAFFSEEYPVWFGTQYNDMYCAWLESEQWTGNISFDEMGNPISLNAGFLDNLPGSPALAGTAMDQNAGTKWLTTTAGVNPGEHIEVVFAVWDLSDGIWDTYLILDNWLWDCVGGPPQTIPG
jgi:hypothetical protein